MTIMFPFLVATNATITQPVAVPPEAMAAVRTTLTFGPPQVVAVAVLIWAVAVAQ